MKLRFLWPCCIWTAVYVIIGLIMAKHTHNLNLDFGVFHSYRMVFNNLKFPEITGWNPMAHPANASELHPYLTMLSPAYLWCMTIWCTLTKLSPEMLRIGSVILYYPPIIFGSLSLVRASGYKVGLPGAMFLFGPLFLTNSICCEWIVMSFGFYLLILAELLKENKSTTKILAFSILSTFFQFLNSIHILIFLILTLSFQKFGKIKPFLSIKSTSLICSGTIISLGISLFLQNLSSDQVMSFGEYAKLRSEQVMIEPQTSTGVLYLWERIWAQAGYNFPIFLIFIMCLGHIFFSVKREDAHKWIVLLACFTHFAYCIIFMATSTVHYYYSFFYLLLTPLTFAICWSELDKNGTLKTIILAFCLAMLGALSLYGVRKKIDWSSAPSKVDLFLGQLKPEDILVRDRQFNAWPLNLANPLNTVYLDRDHPRPEAFNELENGRVFGYELTWNTAYHVRPKYQHWRSYQPGPKGKIFYLTDLQHPEFKPLFREQLNVMHEGLKTYFMYQLSP